MTTADGTSTIPTSFKPEAVNCFTYVGFDFDPTNGVLRCHYALDDLQFEERITFGSRQEATSPEAESAARLVFLLAGISYYKAAAPLLIDVGDHGLTPAERRLLEAFYRDGLGEFAFENGLDLTGLRIEAPAREAGPPPPRSSAARPLVPFGGGIDSIVTVEGIREHTDDLALFVVSREGDRFEAIEAPMAVTGVPVVRAERRLDEKILRSAELGYRNGHVPVTGVISAIAVMAAVLEGRDAVVMSNEWSASAGNVEQDGRMINHQWSKSLAFEDLFRAALAESLHTPFAYFSWLRPFSELWVADRFADLYKYHGVFRSCNRAFHIDPSQRLDHWCGTCDKCVFIDLILSPFVPAATLETIFDGAEPLEDPALIGKFRTLLGIGSDFKPFECVGDVDECRVAVMLSETRPDRLDNKMLEMLVADAKPFVTGDPSQHRDRLSRPLGQHRIPDLYAPRDLLV